MERWGHSLLALLAISFIASPAHAVKVRVLAATRLEARVERDPAASNGVVLKGTLRDDVGIPIPNSHVTLSMHNDTRGGALPLPRAEKCSTASADGAHDPHIAPDEYVVDTDASGSFCIRGPIAVARGVLRLRFQGGAFFERSDADVPFELGRPAATIAFDPEPSIVPLDRPIHTQAIRIVSLGVGRDWHVTLRDERQKVIGAAAFDEEGYARIDVRTAELAGPGTGVLAAALDDAPSSAPISHAVERHATVDLATDDPHPEGDSDDGIPISVRLHSARGEVPSGVVEATIGDRPVGAARVQGSKAVVLARFGAGRAKTATAQLRYLPDTPWWLPGDPLTLTLRIRPPNPWRRAPFLLLALALATWLAREPLRALLRTPRRLRRRAVLPDGGHAMQVGSAGRENADWAGCVFDAHDGTPLAQARVSIVVPGFPGAGGGDGLTVIVATNTTDNGRFALGAESRREGARLRVEAPLHATFEEPLPSPAELSIPLVSRRRRLLDRLVQWATREWDQGVSREPTPAQVVARAAADVTASDAATRERANRVRTWARAVEHAAFDRAPVDEQVERDVLAHEPRPHGSYEDVIAVATATAPKPPSIAPSPASRKP